MKRAPLAALAALAACGGKAPPASDVHDVAVAKVDAGASIETTPAPADAGAANDEGPPIDAGWVTVDYKTGREEYVGREKALAVMREGNTRVLVRLSKVVVECSSVGGTHLFFVPAYAKESPFSAAHFGGHGAHIVTSKGSLFGDAQQLYVASVETHSPSSFGNGRGWCLEEAPPYDADILAIVPVRSEGEGMRLLTKLAR